MANKKYLDYEGLALYTSLIEEKYAPIQAIQFKGTVTNVASLPTVSEVAIGSMYNITESGISTADFVEGAGKVVRNGTNVVAVNTAAANETPVMKWDIIAGVFDISDKLTFGTAMPANPSNGDTFLFLGETTYTYTDVTNSLEAGANPKALGLYEESAGDTYVLTNDETVTDNKDYYEKDEQYVKGVIYVYSTTSSAWVAQSSGDTFEPISTSEINALFS